MLRIISFLAALAYVTPALALPAPMTEQQLTAKSDLVALIEMLSVSCIGALPDFQTKELLLAYQAKARVLDVKKGHVKEGDIITVEFNQVTEAMLGPWTVLYYPGEEVWTHLMTRGQNYRSTWWNARGKLVRPAVISKLPDAPGQTLQIPPNAAPPAAR